MKLVAKILIVVILAVLGIAVALFFLMPVDEEPESMPEPVSAGAENIITNIEESCTAAVDSVKSETTNGNVSAETTIETVTPELLMDRIKSYNVTGKTRQKPATLQVIENGQTLSEVIHKIGDPQGLFEIKDTHTIFLYYTGDLKVDLINGRVVNLPEDFNEKLKEAYFGKEHKTAVHPGAWQKIKKRGRLMKGKIKFLLGNFKKSGAKSK